MGGGGKGSQTVQNQSQTYSANPQIQGAASQAINQAQSAASTPFQMPVAPVAGFSPLQQQAFNQYQALQGSWQPAFAQGENYTAQSAAPITAADVNNYYNPMAANVTAQLQNVFGQQNQQNNANLVQSAGGVGADRIAVGQGTLANQQGLAAGQTYANLYQQALTAAQQQKQLEAGAGAKFQAFGTGTLGNNLQGTNALYGAGQAQQQQTQAELNAPYQNTLARLAYPFQTGQYLAGITGGLAPALGGTTIGQQVTQPPQPSTLSQILGISTAGAGLYGALGGGGLGGGGSAAYGGGNAFTDAYGGSSANPLEGLSASDYGAGFAGGGKVKARQPRDEDIEDRQDEENNRFNDSLYWEGMPRSFEHWAVDEDWDKQAPSPSNTIANQLGGQSPILKGMIDARAGLAGDQFSGFADGGEVEENPSGLHENSVVPTINLQPGAGHSGPLTGGMAFPQPSTQQGQNSTGSEIANLATTAAKIIPFLKRGGKAYPTYADAGGVDDPTEDNGIINQLGTAGRATGPFDRSPDPIYDVLRTNSTPVTGNTPAPPPAMGRQPAVPFPIQTDPFGALPQTQPPPGPSRRKAPAGSAAGSRQETASGVPVGGDDLPYPTNMNGNWGQNAAKSPWLSLVAAGATTASTPGPLGVSLGKGLLAGTKELETQQTAGQKQQTIDQKAAELGETAKEHLKKWNQMTPYERGSLAARNREIDQSDSDSGLDAKTRKNIDVATRFYYTQLSKDPNNINAPPEQLQEKAYQMARKHFVSGGQGAAPAQAQPAEKPPIIHQNGFEYHLQPDGTYK